MDRTRIFDEVVEILANKLHQLPQPSPAMDDEEPFDYERCKLVGDITSNHLDIAEVTMDLEDAFGVAFEDGKLPGGEGLETIGLVVDYIERRVNRSRSAIV
jgi:acyl carrier protein